jgi:hypothetical protein
MKTLRRTMALFAVLTTPAFAQDNAFNWRKQVAAGKTVEVRGVIGDIVATAANGSEVQIVARKSARRSDPASVRIEVVEHADGVTVCAIYEPGDDCHPHDHGQSSRDNDTRVDFEVRVPRGVKLKARSVTGDIRATGLDARVNASSVSGDVRVSTSDIASASTVSGSVEVQMGRTDWTGTLAFSSVSGDIDVAFGSDLNAEISYNTVSGSIDSDWPISMSRGGSRNLRGTVGSGGRRLTLSTVSGDVDLRRSN